MKTMCYRAATCGKQPDDYLKATAFARQAENTSAVLAHAQEQKKRAQIFIKPCTFSTPFHTSSSTVIKYHKFSKSARKL
jgi:hypothetical protein